MPSAGIAPAASTCTLALCSLVFWCSLYQMAVSVVAAATDCRSNSNLCRWLASCSVFGIGIGIGIGIEIGMGVFCCRRLVLLLLHKVQMPNRKRKSVSTR